MSTPKRTKNKGGLGSKKKVKGEIVNNKIVFLCIEGRHFSGWGEWAPAHYLNHQKSETSRQEGDNGTCDDIRCPTGSWCVSWWGCNNGSNDTRSSGRGSGGTRGGRSSAAGGSWSSTRGRRTEDGDSWWGRTNRGRSRGSYTNQVTNSLLWKQ